MASDLFTVIFHFILLKRAGLVEVSQLVYLGKPFAALIPLAPVYWVAHRLPPVLQCVILLPLYGVFILWFRVFQKDEIGMFRKSIEEKLRKLFGNSGVAKE